MTNDNGFINCMIYKFLFPIKTYCFECKIIKKEFCSIFAFLTKIKKNKKKAFHFLYTLYLVD
ncbi:MAG: hypothetical protein EBQ94_09975 [Flavobacteriales bacterium]|nr:hypothetical protein [Flavobacteriales bacterium]